MRNRTRGTLLKMCENTHVAVHSTSRGQGCWDPELFPADRANVGGTAPSFVGRGRLDGRFVGRYPFNSGPLFDELDVEHCEREQEFNDPTNSAEFSAAGRGGAVVFDSEDGGRDGKLLGKVEKIP